MTHTALTADEEIRRIQRLGEARNNRPWGTRPSTGQPRQETSVVQNLRAGGAVLLRAIPRWSARAHLQTRRMDTVAERSRQ